MDGKPAKINFWDFLRQVPIKSIDNGFLFGR
jgi:hypothetical protein